MSKSGMSRTRPPMSKGAGTVADDRPADEGLKRNPASQGWMMGLGEMGSRGGGALKCLPRPA